MARQNMEILPDATFIEPPLEPKIKPSWKSGEFWASIGVAVVAIIGAAVGLGLVKPEDQAMLSQNITSIVGSIGSLVIAGATVYGYMAKRFQYKADVARAAVQMRFSETAKPADVTISQVTETK